MKCQMSQTPPQHNISHGQRKPTLSYSRADPEGSFLPCNFPRPGRVRNKVTRAKKMRKMGKRRKICMPLPPLEASTGGHLSWEEAKGNFDCYMKLHIISRNDTISETISRLFSKSGKELPPK